jgi:hypothetical protein
VGAWTKSPVAAGTSNDCDSCPSSSARSSLSERFTLPRSGIQQRKQWVAGRRVQSPPRPCTCRVRCLDSDPIQKSVWSRIRFINASSQRQARSARSRSAQAAGHGTRSSGAGNRSTPLPGRPLSHRRYIKYGFLESVFIADAVFIADIADTAAGGGLRVIGDI